MISTIKTNCLNCKKELNVRRERIKEDGNLCRSCFAIVNNKSRTALECKRCGIDLNNTNKVSYQKGKSKRAYCKDCFKIIEHDKRNAIKKLVMDYFGGCCVCCGEDSLEFLTLDHINNDGAEHRKQFKDSFGDKLYSNLLRNNFTSKYELQILCWNCNLAKQNYGECPHNRP